MSQGELPDIQELQQRKSNIKRKHIICIYNPGKPFWNKVLKAKLDWATNCNIYFRNQHKFYIHISVISKVVGKLKSNLSTNWSSSLVSICLIKDGDNGVKWWLLLKPGIVFPFVNHFWRFLLTSVMISLLIPKKLYWWCFLLAKSKHWFIMKYFIVQRSLQTSSCCMFHCTTNPIIGWFAMMVAKKSI